MISQALSLFEYIELLTDPPPKTGYHDTFGCVSETVCVQIPDNKQVE